jgi:DNA (cytosine-5)-methyltransferase 1
VFSFARLVGALKPRYFVMENVPGIASVRAGETPDAELLIELLIEEFENYGYLVDDPHALNAYNFGVPQDRRRTLLVGRAHGEEAVLPPSPATRGRTRGGADAPTTVGYDENLGLCPSVADAIGDLPDLDDSEHSARSDVVPLDEDALSAMERRASGYVRLLRGLDSAPDDFSYPRKWERRKVTSSYRTVHDVSVRKRFDQTPQGHSESVSRFFRLHPTGVSSTLRAGTHYDRGSFNAPRPIHPHRPRVISVREAARLHGYPDWFRFH